MLEEKCDFLTLLQTPFVLSEHYCLYYNLLFFSPPTFSFLLVFAYLSPFSCDNVFLKVSVSLAVPLAKWIGTLTERLPCRWSRALGSRLGTWPSLAQIGFQWRAEQNQPGLCHDSQGFLSPHSQTLFLQRHYFVFCQMDIFPMFMSIH